MPVTVTSLEQCSDQPQFRYINNRQEQMVRGLMLNVMKEPDLPSHLLIHPPSAAIFDTAPVDCYFTGAVHLPTNCIYLHSLVATRKGNVELGTVENLKFSSSAGDLAGNIKSILHPNLTQEEREAQGLTSGHTQICAKFGLKEHHCIGFAIAKGAYAKHTMTTSSQTLNSTKFKFFKDRDIVELTSRYPVTARNAITRLENKLGTGHISKAWANLIARTLAVRLCRDINVTARGSSEAPF